MSKKFWASYSIKQEPSKKQEPAVLTRELRVGRVDVSKMSIPELHTHMTNESNLLRNIREASGLPAIRPLQSEYVNNVNSTNALPIPNLTDFSTPIDNTRVNRRKP